MTETDRYSMMIDALAELTPEIQARQPLPRAAVPALGDVLKKHPSLPREALFLGVATDGFPVLLNLLDPVPGPMLIAADQGSGKTAFLRMIARSVDRMHSPGEVQYGILTAHPDEWKDYPAAQNCIDVFASYERRSGEFLSSLAAWAHSNRGERQSLLLLIDDLSLITKMDYDDRQNLRWLLLRGPARRVWPIVTSNARETRPIQAWLEFFRTRFFGRIRDDNDLRFLTGSNDDALKSLKPGSEFVMREGDHWTKFWIPGLE